MLKIDESVKEKAASFIPGLPTQKWHFLLDTGAAQATLGSWASGGGRSFSAIDNEQTKGRCSNVERTLDRADEWSHSNNESYPLD